MNNITDIPNVQNWEDEEFDYVPLSQLTESEIIEQRAEHYATIISIQTQLADNEIFPRRDETWVIRAKSKIKHLRLESSVLNSELHARDKAKEDIRFYTKEKQRTKRHMASELRKLARMLYKDGLFVLTCKELLTPEQMAEIWKLAAAQYPNAPCWNDPEFDKMRDEVCIAFAQGKGNYEDLAKEFGFNRNSIRRFIEDRDASE